MDDLSRDVDYLFRDMLVPYKHRARQWLEEGGFARVTNVVELEEIEDFIAAVIFPASARPEKLLRRRLSDIGRALQSESRAFWKAALSPDAETTSMADADTSGPTDNNDARPGPWSAPNAMAKRPRVDIGGPSNLAARDNAPAGAPTVTEAEVTTEAVMVTEVLAVMATEVVMATDAATATEATIVLGDEAVVRGATAEEAEMKMAEEEVQHEELLTVDAACTSSTSTSNNAASSAATNDAVTCQTCGCPTMKDRGRVVYGPLNLGGTRAKVWKGRQVVQPNARRYWCKSDGAGHGCHREKPADGEGIFVHPLGPRTAVLHPVQPVAAPNLESDGQPGESSNFQEQMQMNHAPAPAPMEPVVVQALESAADGVSDSGDGQRCLLRGCSHKLLKCRGHGATGNGHILCASCLTAWFQSQAELRDDAGERHTHRHQCPVCQVELRVVRGDERFHQGLLKIPESWG